jgi:DNA-binding LytR/AlgR family response regulator
MYEMRVAICDDEQAHLELLRQCVRNCAMWKDAQPSVRSFASGEKLLADIREGKSYDYIFLDVNMPEINGIDLCARISELTEASVIFVSTHMEHQPSVDSFYPAMLLPKPFTQEAFDNIIRAYQARKRARKHFEFVHKDEKHSLLCKDIYFFSMFDHHLMITATTETYQSASMNLGDVEKKLDSSEGFYRCHKSYLINLRYYEKHDYGNVYLRIGEKLTPIPLSKGKGNGSAVKEAYLKYIVGGRYAF